jgi:hypothetical protein
MKLGGGEGKSQKSKVKSQKAKVKRDKGEIQEGKIMEYNHLPKTVLLENLFFIDLSGIPI